MEPFICDYCGAAGERQRATKRFCSTTCAQRKGRGWPKVRSCRHCSAEFTVAERRDANRQHCSKQCAKNATAKRVRSWKDENPGYMGKYNRNRVEKNPGAYRDKAAADRAEIIRLLGGECVVCAVTNPKWLHVDFIPTTRGRAFRHPRHLKWVRENIHDFRLLCANHHYELTLTGKIEGSAITQ